MNKLINRLNCSFDLLFQCVNFEWYCFPPWNYWWQRHKLIACRLLHNGHMRTNCSDTTQLPIKLLSIGIIVYKQQTHKQCANWKRKRTVHRRTCACGKSFKLTKQIACTASSRTVSHFSNKYQLFINDYSNKFTWICKLEMEILKNRNL